MARGMARRRSTSDPDDYSPSDKDEAPDEAPARGSRRGRSESAAPARGGARGGRSRTSQAEETEETPRRATRRPEPEKPQRPKGTGGWGTFEKKKSEQSDFPDEFTPSDEQTLIKFVDEAPFANYYQHWIERKGKKSWTCLEDDCPLCDEIGDKPQLKVLFNIIDLADPDNPANSIWKVGSQVAEQLKNFGSDSKTGPLNREDLYWAVSRTKNKNKWVTNISPVKERDVVEDWNVEPLTNEELDEFDEKAFDEDVVEFHTKKQLQEIVDEG